METVKETLKKRKQFLEQLQKELQQKLKRSPEGCLRISCSKGRVQYYHRLSTKDKQGKYLPKSELALIDRLAGKDYCLRVLKSTEQESRAIDDCLRQMPDISAEEVYEKLPKVRQIHILPIIESEEHFVAEWSSKSYTGKEIFGDTPEYLTDRGERVRSKSELIIANMLYKENIPYRYEYPVELDGFGTVYPDFTVLNIRERKEMIWEHQGMMDDPDYAEKALRKLNAYMQNGYFPGNELIVSFETSATPLSIRQIRDLIMRYLL